MAHNNAATSMPVLDPTQLLAGHQFRQTLAEIGVDAIERQALRERQLTGIGAAPA